MGIERACAFLSAMDDVEALLVAEDGALWITPGLYAAFTPMNAWAWAKINVIQ